MMKLHAPVRTYQNARKGSSPEISLKYLHQTNNENSTLLLKMYEKYISSSWEYSENYTYNKIGHFNPRLFRACWKRK